jgi:hypothetical protein
MLPSLTAYIVFSQQTAHISEDERQILETRVRELDAELQCVRHRLQDVCVVVHPAELGCAALRSMQHLTGA